MGPWHPFATRAAWSSVVKVSLLHQCRTSQDGLDRPTARAPVGLLRQCGDMWVVCFRWSKGAARGACVFCVAVMIIPTVCALRWSAVMGQFRTTITHHTGIVSADAVESPLAASYSWPWTNPMLSLAVRSSADDAVVANSAPFASITVQSAGIVVPPAYRWGK